MLLLRVPVRIAVGICGLEDELELLPPRSDNQSMT
ncbi:MAG: hypothetical protein FD138_3388 [Planctomycetota bacterium]|nr:MAG: hypothetical protein FD138_3388 [Planctomycetota bacterium]